MLKSKVEEALNEQIQKEAYSSHIYLAMASWAETNGYNGSAAFLYAQSEEERMHMLKIFRYVNDRGGKAIAPVIDKPELDYDNIKQVFEKVYEHEKFVTQSINDIVGICLDEKDYTTHQFLQWFVQEQIEEESNASEILDRLNLLGDDRGRLYMFDKDMAAFHPDTAGV